MADVAQWTVTKTYDELSKIDAAGRRELANLDAQRLSLQQAYSRARAAADSVTMRFLDPLIHKNSELRLRSRDYIAKFNQTVGAVSNLLRAAGLKVPATLSGMLSGPELVIVPVAVVIALGVLWGIVHEVMAGRNAVDQALASEAKRLFDIANDPTRTPAERADALKAYNELMARLGANPKGLLDNVPMILGLVLAILVAPTVIKLVQNRKGVTA